MPVSVRRSPPQPLPLKGGLRLGSGQPEAGDGEVQLRDAGHLALGDIVSVTIEDADDHDLYGVPA